MIKGGLRMLKDQSPQIVMEVQTDKVQRIVYLETIALLEGLGYRVHEIQKDGFTQASRGYQFLDG